MPAAQRHRLIYTQRGVLLVAAAMAVAGGAFIPTLPSRLASLALGLLIGVGWLFQRRTRPVLVVDDAGYHVEQGSTVRFRVAWSEVKRVRLDETEAAMHLDCGDVSRNLLVPPARGWGYRWEDQTGLVRRVLAAVPERVERVERLDPEMKKSR